MATGSMSWVHRLAHLFSAMVCAICAYYAVSYIQYEFEDGTIAFGVVPVWLCQSIIPFGFAVMACRFLNALFSLDGQAQD